MASIELLSISSLPYPGKEAMVVEQAAPCPSDGCGMMEQTVLTPWASAAAAMTIVTGIQMNTKPNWQATSPMVVVMDPEVP